MNAAKTRRGRRDNLLIMLGAVQGSLPNHQIYPQANPVQSV